MTRESLKDLQIDEISTVLEAELVQFSEEMQGKTVEELKESEAALMEEFKNYEEYVKDVTYEVPMSVEYDGQSFKASEVHKKIIFFLNKLEVDFRATLGIYQAIRFWKTLKDNTVPYHVYDSTVRLLGTLKFKGESECLDVLIINNYFSPTHAEYSKDNTYLQYLSAKHQVIMKAMEGQGEDLGIEPAE